MTYGRLDVFWPDGKFETFLLTEPNISVGRSSGNSIMLDTDTISRYHFSLTLEGGAVTIADLDSANGTFVDGARLVGNERVVLRGGEEVQIGHLRMNFHALDDQPTLPIHALAEDTQRVEKESVEFRVELQLPHIAVAPGSYTSVELTVHNTGEAVRQYVVGVGGLPDGWARVNRPLVEIDPGDSTLILINIKPLRRSDSKPGLYPAIVSVHPKDQPDQRLDAEMRVTILPFSGFGMALTPRRLFTGEKARLHLHNQGSAPLALHLAAQPLDDALTISVQPANVTLAPGQRAQAEVQARPSRGRLFGPEREHHFDLLVRSQDAAHFLVSSRGRLIDRPPLPSWALPVLGVLLLGALALLVVGLSAALRPVPAPEILSFVVNDGLDQVARGDDLRFAWTVSNAEEVRIEADGQLIARISVDAGGISDDSGSASTAEWFTPSVTLRAIAAGRGGTVQQERIVQLYDRVSIASFTAEPPQLVRHVRQTLTLRWEGFGEASLSGLDGFTAGQPPVMTAGGAQANGYAEADLDLLLTVQGANNQRLEQALRVPALPAQCTSLPGEFTLGDGPSPDAGAVTTITPLTTLTTDGRSGDGQWLRFVVADGVTAWGARDAFRCNDNFSVEDLRVVDGAATDDPRIVPPLTQVTPAP